MALAPLNPETRNLIDGKLVAASNGATFENVNPATEEVIGVCADGTKDDMHAAIAAARRAFDETDWSTNPAFRKRCLRQLADGAPGGEGGAARDRRRRGGLAGAAHLRGAVRHLHRRRCPTGPSSPAATRTSAPMRDIPFMGQPQRRLLRREATGVVGAITPWNFPLYLNLCKLGPALAAGNTRRAEARARHAVVARRTSAASSPSSTDIPAGVVNVVASSDHARRRDPRRPTRASTSSPSPARPRPAGA